MRLAARRSARGCRARSPCCQPSTTTSPCVASSAAIDALARQLRQQLGHGGGAEDDLAPHPRRASAMRRLERRGCRRRRGTAQRCDEARDQRRVAALAEGGVEIDHRDLAGDREPLGDRQRIAGVERLLLAADELHGLAALQIDRRDDHGRTSMPCGQEMALDVVDRVSPSWKIEAASTASAPASNASPRCARPRRAARGDHRHAHGARQPRRSARGRSRSACRPGPRMVSRISPAPRRSRFARPLDRVACRCAPGRP